MNNIIESTLKLLFANQPERIQQSEWEMRTFLERVQNELKPQRTVELGTWRGATAALLSLVTGTKTITVDKDDYGTTDVTLPSHNLTRLLRDGHNPETVKEVQAMMGAPLDLLFIDDGHRIEEVTADYNLWKETVRPGGWIAFHDINPLANRLVNNEHADICQSHVHWAGITGNKQEIIDPKPTPPGPGIGILFV